MATSAHGPRGRARVRAGVGTCGCLGQGRGLRGRRECRLLSSCLSCTAAESELSPGSGAAPFRVHACRHG